LNLKNSFNKRKKQIKRMRVKLKKIKQQKLWLNYKIESQKNFNKSVKEKYYKKDQNKKTKHMRNCNWRTKLKKKSIQEIRKK
jgi:hypothetical protein